MAIRNIATIDNAVNVFKDKETLAVEHIKAEFRFYYDKVLSESKDIIDAIDTIKYCKEKGLLSKLSCKEGSKVGKITFENNMLNFQFNEWRRENTGLYNWFVMTDGKEVFIQVDSSRSDVPSMIKRALYYKDDVSGDRVIAPIYETYGGTRGYSPHKAERPLSALKEFARLLPIFLSEFFIEVENLGKQAS